MSDGAIEAKVHATSGCAGLWLRTGDRGYVLAYCADGYVRIHKLGDRAPGPANMLNEWTLKTEADPYVAFVAKDQTSLVFYVNGMQFGPVSDNVDPIKSGKINLGAFTDGSDGANVDISEVRVFLPAQTNTGGNNSTGSASPRSSWSGSPSTSPSGKKSPTSTPQPTN
jgi:hypothetical protein